MFSHESLNLVQLLSTKVKLCRATSWTDTISQGKSGPLQGDRRCSSLISAAAILFTRCQHPQLLRVWAIEVTYNPSWPCYNSWRIINSCNERSVVCRNWRVESPDVSDCRTPPRCRWELRSSGNITQRIVIVPYRRFGTTYRFHLKRSRSRTLAYHWRFGTTYQSHHQGSLARKP